GESLRIEHWTHATEMADAAVTSLLAGSGPCDAFGPIPYFWSDQYDVKIQLAGRTLPGDRVEIVDGALADRRFVALYGREDRLVAVLGFNRPRVVMQYRKLLREGVSFAQALRGPGA